MIANALGVPVVALVPVALVAVAVLAFFLDGLSHTVLKPFKSPPVIATLPRSAVWRSSSRDPSG